MSQHDFSVPGVIFNGRWYPLPRGGADDTPTEPPEPPDGGPQPEPPDEEPEASVPDLPEELAGIDEADLRATYAQLQTLRDDRLKAARTPSELDEVDQIIERQNRIATEITRRREQAAQVEQRRQALSETELVALPEEEPVAVASAGAGASATQLAAVARPQPPGVVQPPAPRPERPRVAMVAAAGAGDELPMGHEISWDQLGRSYDRLKDKEGGTTILASIPGFEGMDDPSLPEPLLKRNGVERNAELMWEAIEDWKARQPWASETMQAAMGARQGAICTPLDILRDIPDAFSTATPVADIFPARPAGRLGYQFVPSVVLSDVAGGSVIWNDTNQAAVDPTTQSTWKPVVDVTCPAVSTITAEAVTAGLRFDITTEMAAPERVRNMTNALMALKARTKEGRLLQRIDLLSHAWQFFGDYGALPALIEAMNTVLAQVTYTDRQEDARYTLIVPPAALEVLTIDRANRGYNPGESGEGNLPDVLDYLRANIEGVSAVVESLDGALGGQPGTPITWPAVGHPRATVPYIQGGEYRFRLVSPADAVYSESGEINVGVVRDASLIRQNKSIYFAEEFFMLGKIGPAQWVNIDVKLCADGSRAGLIAPNGCVVS